MKRMREGAGAAKESGQAASAVGISLLLFLLLFLSLSLSRPLRGQCTWHMPLLFGFGLLWLVTAAAARAWIKGRGTFLIEN